MVMMKNLKPGETRILACGRTADGVEWQDYERAVPHTIGITRGFRLVYEGRELTTAPRGRDILDVAAEFKAHIDGLPARIAANEAAQQAAIAETIRIQFERERERKRLNILDYTQVCDAWAAAHGDKQPPKSLIIRWAHSGVTQAEHDSAWYKAGIAKHGARR